MRLSEVDKKIRLPDRLDGRGSPRMRREREVAELRVCEGFGNLLMLRDSAAALLRKVESLTSHRVMLDFANVDFMSRSFADEYLLGKARSRKALEERSLPAEARLMMESVSRRIESRRADSSRVKARFSARISKITSP
jgi:hypothetical protein